MSALLQAASGSLLGEMFAVLQALAALVLVALLVWLARRALQGGRFGLRRGERIQIEERLAIDMRNAL
ncbi:MAG TPA: hypothetical protein VG963_16010, partial [Polyangiaceae bacterium]|nr:hypothetical protein [Polyangiaceae bacterium]